MPTRHSAACLIVALIIALVPLSSKADEPGKEALSRGNPIPLWPGIAPGEKGDIGEEHDTTKPDPKVPKEKYIIRLGNVSKPTLTVFRPPADKETKAALDFLASYGRTATDRSAWTAFTQALFASAEFANLR